MGRDLKSEGDSDGEQDEELKQIHALMNAGPDSDNNSPSKPSNATTTTLAEKLRKDLMCAVCHDVVYPPISLMCGHSFCQPCIEWWFDTDSSCPTCRRTVAGGHEDVRSPNLALRAAVMAVFGPEIISRIKSRKPKGEQGGAHDAGYEVLSDLDNETWHYVQTIAGTSLAETIQARRSIVLDANDQRMQLALAIYEKPEKLLDNRCAGFRVKLCLLTMEEDEVEDSGFPVNIVTPEDEQLICGRDDRFLHSFLDVQMKTANGDVSPLARVAADANGYFDYVLDPTVSAGDPSEARILIFQHEVTGCHLEIDLAQLQTFAGGSKLRPQIQPSRQRRHSNTSEDEEEDEDDDHHRSGRTKHRSFVMGQDDDSDMEDEDRFEEDGFLVADGDGDSAVEGEFSEDDKDLCAVCKEAGELMVCDGGDEDDGCGRAFHVGCINRQVVPDGDWICQECAKSAGIQVGPEGHEFRPKLGDEKDKLQTGQNNGKKRVLEDSDSDSAKEDVEEGRRRTQQHGEIQQAKNPKKRRVLEDSDSD